MNTYRVKYWSMSGAIVAKFLEASTQEEAVEIAKKQDECFDMLRGEPTLMDMSDPVTRSLVEQARR